MPPPPIHSTQDGVEIAVWVQPRASRTRIVGLHGEAIKVQLAAPPVDGAANAALCRFLAKRLGVARSEVEICAGHSSRSKRVRVRGVEEATVREALL